MADLLYDFDIKVAQRLYRELLDDLRGLSDAQGETIAAIRACMEARERVDRIRQSSGTVPVSKKLIGWHREMIEKLEAIIESQSDTSETSNG